MSGNRNPIEEIRKKLASQAEGKKDKSEAQENAVPKLGPIGENVIRMGLTMSTVPAVRTALDFWRSYRTVPGATPAVLAGARIFPALKKAYTAGVTASGVRAATAHGRDPAHKTIFGEEETRLSATEGTRVTSAEGAKLTSEEATATEETIGTRIVPTPLQAVMLSSAFAVTDTFLTHRLVLKGLFAIESGINPDYKEPKPETMRDKVRVYRTGVIPRTITTANGVGAMFLSDAIEARLNQGNCDPYLSKVLGTCLSGGLNGAINCPIYDTFVRQISSIPHSAPFKAQSYRSVWTDTWRKEGFRGLTRGKWPSIIYSMATLGTINATDYAATNAVIPAINTGLRGTSSFFRPAPAAVSSQDPKPVSENENRAKLMSCTSY